MVNHIVNNSTIIEAFLFFYKKKKRVMEEKIWPEENARRFPSLDEGNFHGMR